jgi:hypothetical protein
MQNHVAASAEKDPVPKVDGELAVGEDVVFQRKWWKFERFIFSIFVLMIALDLLGAFGRGYLALAEKIVSQGAARVRYERIERAGTPSILTVDFSPAAVQHGSVQLWMSEAITQGLGTQRIIPQPTSSTLQGGGILYRCPVTSLPAKAQFALQPAHPGKFDLQIRIGSFDESRIGIVVMP